MKRLSFRKSIVLCVCLLLAVTAALAGCESIQGVDVSRALINELNVHSVEGSGTLTVQVSVDDSVKSLPEQEQRMLRLLENLQLEVTSLEEEDSQHLSLQGILHAGTRLIPLTFAMSPEHTAIQVEGMANPLILSEGLDLPADEKDLQAKITAAAPEIQKVVSGYLVPNLPNPAHITVESVNEQIHGETLSLHHIHGEVDGTEAIGLIKKLLTNLLADEDGLRAMLNQLYDALAPILLDTLKSEDDSSEITAYLENKMLAVEFVFTTVQNALKKAIDSFDEEALQASDPELWTKDNMISEDLYVDQSLQLRRSVFSLHLNPEAEGIASISVSGDMQFWNVDGDVKAQAIDTTGATKWDPSSNPVTLLRTIDKQSDLYQLLKNDLQITRQEIHMDMSNGQQPDATRPYRLHGAITMVPVRFVSEEMNAEVKWNGAAQAVTIVDLETGKTIVLTKGSKTAQVEGQPVALDAPMELRSNSAFVPLRFIAETLGAKVQWNDADAQILITKD